MSFKGDKKYLKNHRKIIQEISLKLSPAFDYQLPKIVAPIHFKATEGENLHQLSSQNLRMNLKIVIMITYICGKLLNQ